MALTVSEYVDVEVSDDEMIEHLENYGWIVVHRDEYDENPFSNDDIRLMMAVIEERGYTVGSDLYNLREKLAQTLR